MASGELLIPDQPEEDDLQQWPSEANRTLAEIGRLLGRLEKGVWNGHYGKSTFGDFVAGTYLTHESTGDTYWTGEGSGLVFGHMYTNATIAVILTDQSTWYELDGATAWITGELNGCTFTDPGITVLKAGRYSIRWSLATDFSATPGSKQEVEYGIMVDGAIQNGGRTHRTLANSTDTGSTCSEAILDLAANAVISLAARNETSAGKTIHVEHGNLHVVQIGGT